MANLTASSAAPTVTWDDTSVGTDQWRLLHDSGPLRVQSRTGVSWNEHFTFRKSGSQKCLAEFEIEDGTPILTFDNTSGGNDYRLRSSGGQLQVQVDDSGYSSLLEFNATGNIEAYAALELDMTEPTIVLDPGTGANFEIAANNNELRIKTFVSGSAADALFIDASPSQLNNVYINDALAVGAGASSSDAIQWRTFTGALDDTTSTITVDVTLGTERTIVGALVMLTPETADDVDATYNLYDYRSTSASQNFFVDVERGNASGQDTVIITYDLTSYAPSPGSRGRYKILAFYAPNL